MDLIKIWLAQFDWERLLTAGGRILLILLLAWISILFIRVAVRRMATLFQHRAEKTGRDPGEVSKRADTLTALLSQGMFVLVWIVVALVVLSEFGVSIGPILASAGIVGLAVGFGAQNLVRDVISGLFIIIENQVRIGDVAVVNGTGGLIEEINFRTLVLRDLSGTVHIFPNGTITTLSNMTLTWSAYVFNVSIAYEEEPDQAMEIMRRVGEELQADPHFGSLIIEPVEIFGVDQLAESAVVIQGRLKTRPIRQWEVGREYLKRVKRALEEQGVEIPLPQTVLRFGEEFAPLLEKLKQEPEHSAQAKDREAKTQQ